MVDDLADNLTDNLNNITSYILPENLKRRLDNVNRFNDTDHINNILIRIIDKISVEQRFGNTMTEHNVFMSPQDKDVKKAQKIVEVLQKEGFDVHLEVPPPYDEGSRIRMIPYTFIVIRKSPQ